ncbi:hypothetical protein O3M35_012913 [Rhynocoris fuscipes]|uniref:Uncharacterized protein n=1 Tax=Rhynocoris fuscipes TaxID=488301 RepID=A0AAW1CHS1_9HEMI
MVMNENNILRIHCTSILASYNIITLTTLFLESTLMEIKDLRIKTLQISILFLILVITKSECSDRAMKKHPRETNLVNFVRLLVLRLIYGFATMLGLQDSISEVANGALVPPGVEDDYSFGDYREYDADYY